MKTIQLIVLSLFVSALSFGQVNLENQIDSVSYSLGSDIGANLKKSGAIEINFEAFTQAMKSALGEDELLISEKERMEIIRGIFKPYKAKSLEKTKKKGLLFWRQIKKKKV